MIYEIMHKDDQVTIADFSPDGEMKRFMPAVNKDLIPLWDKTASDNLRRWWKNRSIPVSQGKVAEMLKKEGWSGTDEFLLKNLGLSLTDCYWIRPEGSELKWKDVNLFENDFRENLLNYQFEDHDSNMHTYHPNSSLQGDLEKTWAIFSGTRVLIKGNHTELSSESINEVFASRIHEMQGFSEYTPYYLIPVEGRSYDFGCYAKAFTTEKLEFVPAYAVVTAEKQPNHISDYEFFISQCVKHGLDEAYVRNFMEYETMIDFILSGRDRHWNNFGVLRDSDTLKFVKMAPIFDSGKCLFVNQTVPQSDKALLNIQTTSFANTILKMLNTVMNRNIVNLDRLPSKDELRSFYVKDSKMEDWLINQICDGYERNIELCRKFQSGTDLSLTANPYRI